MVAPTGQVKILDRVYLLKTAGIIYLHGVMALDIGTCRQHGACITEAVVSPYGPGRQDKHNPHAGALGWLLRRLMSYLKAQTFICMA
jgi:hypothetical protein